LIVSKIYNSVKSAKMEYTYFKILTDNLVSIVPAVSFAAVSAVIKYTK